MDFLKDLLKLQHEITLDKVSTIILTDEFEKKEFTNKYNKRNYCLVKVCNCKMCDKCVKIDDIIYQLHCDHNPSLNR